MQPQNSFWDAFRRPWHRAWLTWFAVGQLCAAAATIWLRPPLGLYIEALAFLIVLASFPVVAGVRYRELRHHLKAMKAAQEERERELRQLLNG